MVTLIRSILRKTLSQFEFDSIRYFENFDSYKKMLCIHDHILFKIDSVWN